MSFRSLSRLSWLPLMLALLAGATVASGAVKKWTASATPVETVFEGGEKSDLPFAEPSRFMVDSKGNVVLLDKRLSAVFKLDKKGKVLWKVQGTPGNPKRFRTLEDLYIDRQDQVWVLDFISRSLALFSPEGKYLRSVALERMPRRFVINSAGEIVTNPGTGPRLLDVYSREGKYLRSFGERFKYDDKNSDFELNSGRMAAGPKGEIYFSFSYPPVIRAYSGQGQLLWENRIPFDQPLRKPLIDIRKFSEDRIGATIQYQIASLDLGVDKAGRLLCLTAGTTLEVAFLQGSQRIDAFSPQGQHLGALSLPSTVNRMSLHPSGLFLLENRNIKSLTRFVVQTTG